MSLDAKPVMESIEDLVFNQDQIVTYQRLSKILNIHVNTAKQWLFKFSSERGESEVLTTYLLCGATSEGRLEVHVVAQSRLDQAKAELESVTCQHVYSVQRAKSSLTSSELYLVDSFTSSLQSTNIISGIAEREVKLRDLKFAARKDSVAPSKTKIIEKKPPEPPAKKNESNHLTSETDKIDKATKDEPAKGKDITTPATSKSPVKAKIVSPTKSKKKGVSAPKGTSIGALFSRQNALNADKKKSDPKVVSSDPGSDESILPSSQKEAVGKKQENLVENSENEDNASEKTILKTPTVKKRKGRSKSQQGGNKRKKREDDLTPASKRRKRIQLASDSDSSEGEDSEEGMEEEMESEHRMEIPDSDEEVIPPTPYSEKKRVRKQISRTFQDEDGFITTLKEYVYENHSDDENKDKSDKAISVESFNTSKDTENESKSDTKESPIEQSKSASQMEDSLERTSKVKEKLNSPETSKESLKDSKPKKVSEPDNKKLNKSDKKVKEKSKPEKKSKVKTSPAKKDKQASIMSFFKKK